MKAKKILLIIVAIEQILVACSSEDKEMSPGLIRIGTSLEAAVDAGATRAANNLQESTLATAEGLAMPGVYVWYTGETALKSVGGVDYGYANQIATAVGTSGALTVPDMYFPVDKSGVDVYVYSPSVSSGANWSAMPISVESDQSGSLNYLKSDFLWGKATTAFNTNASVILSHVLSKVIIKITKGTGVSSLANLQSVTLGTTENKVKLNATVNMANGTPTIGSTEDVVTFASSLGLTSSSNDVEYAAILPPGQSLDGKTVTLNFSDNVSYTGTIDDTSYSLTTKEKYTINVTVGMGKVQITGITITPWTGESSVSVDVM